MLELVYGRSPRFRRYGATVVAGALAAALTFLAALAAPSGIQVQSMPGELCLGGSLTPSVRYRVKVGGSPKFKVTIQDPGGKAVMKGKGKAKKRWKRFTYVPAQPGSYKTTYRVGKKRRTFVTEVTDCSTPPPPPPEGTVDITDDDAGAAMFPAGVWSPGLAREACPTVTYQGTVPATVRLYGATSGTGLDQFLQLTVTRGTAPGPFDSCAGFVPDAINYMGAGAGVIYSGTLQEWADDYAGGLVDPVAGLPENWTSGESHSYRFRVSLPVGAPNAAQDLTSGQTFVWEARD